MGIGKRAHTIHMIDYGLAKRYIMLDGSHIPVFFYFFLQINQKPLLNNKVSR